MPKMHIQTMSKLVTKLRSNERKAAARVSAAYQHKHAGSEVQGILIYVAFICVYIASTTKYFDKNIFFFSSSLKVSRLQVQ
jgi:hypothetical protein